MSDKALRSKIIRLAHSKPELRPHLLPLLSKTAKSSFVQMLEDAKRELWDVAEADIISTIEYSSASETQKKIYGAKNWRDLPREGRDAVYDAPLTNDDKRDVQGWYKTYENAVKVVRKQFDDEVVRFPKLPTMPQNYGQLLNLRDDFQKAEQAIEFAIEAVEEEEREGVIHRI